VHAQKLIDDFIAQAQAAGLAPVPLKARTYTGKIVRTNRAGWYLRNDGSVAIGSDGSYLQLVIPSGVFDRFRRVSVAPSAPPLVVGKGGRDGESGELSFFLARALNGEVTGLR
jgi:hypothetical protein